MTQERPIDPAVGPGERLGSVGSAIAAGVAVAGLLALFGAFFDLSWARGAVAGQEPIALGEAVGFTLSGLGLLAAARARFRFAAAWFGVMLVGLGGAAIATAIVGIRADVAIRLVAGIVFCGTGLGLVSPRLFNERFRPLLLAIEFGVAALATVILLSHAYGVSELITPGNDPVSLAGSIVLAAVSWSLVAGGSGGAGLLASPGPGGVLVRHLLPAAVAVALISGSLYSRVSGAESAFVFGIVAFPLTVLAWLGVIVVGSELERRDAARRRLLDELDRAAHEDEMTGLANRRAFLDALRRQLDDCASRGRSGVLLLLDLDGLKQVNDRFGHAAGDKLICETAERLRGCSRGGDLVARFGGDEFAILLAGQGVLGAEAVADRIVATFRLRDSAPGELESRRPGGISIGISVFSGDDSFDTILARADDALYDSKADGGSTWRIAVDGAVSAPSADPTPKPVEAPQRSASQVASVGNVVVLNRFRRSAGGRSERFSRPGLAELGARASRRRRPIEEPAR